MGFAVSDPYGRTPAAAFPVSLNVQACASLDTFADEIVDPVASRVFARSAFEYGHEPEPAVVEAAAFVVTVVQPELAAAVARPAAGRNQQPSRDKQDRAPAWFTTTWGHVSRARRPVAQHVTAGVSNPCPQPSAVAGNTHRRSDPLLPEREALATSRRVDIRTEWK